VPNTDGKNELLDQPLLVLNTDESRMPLNPEQLNGICKCCEKTLLQVGLPPVTRPRSQWLHAPVLQVANGDPR